MARRNAWLTPDGPPPEEERGRAVYIPNDQALVGAITGALYPLTLEQNWEQHGDMTPAEVALLMSEMLDAFINSDLSQGGPCIPRLGGQKVTRKNPETGEFEQIGDDGETWEEPTDDIAIPAPAPRTENTDDAKKCAGATNAANVIHELYLQALDYYENNINPETALNNILDGLGEFAMQAIGTLLKAASGLIAFAWEALYQIMGVLTEDVWDADFEDDLTCLFLQYAEVGVDGTVTFQYGNLQNAIFSLGNYDAERILLCWQVYYFLSIIGADGLNAAGSTTAIEDPLCGCGSWGRSWLFADLENSEWTKLQGLWNTEDAITPTGVWPGFFAAVSCRVNIPAETTIVQMGVRAFMAATGYAQVAVVYRANPSTSFIHSGQPDDYPFADAPYLTIANSSISDQFVDVVMERIGDGTERTITVSLRTSRAGASLRGFRIWGNGICPFTTGAVI